MTRCDNCSLAVESSRTGDESESKGLCEPCTTLARSDSSVRLSPLERADLELVLAWRSNPEIYRHFRLQTGPLDWNEHVTWFESRPPDRHDFIIHYRGRRVGVVSIESDDSVGIYLGDFSARGHGVATRALNWLCNRFENRWPLVAEIHEKNDASKQLFRRCGFRQKCADGEWLRYRYDP